MRISETQKSDSKRVGIIDIGSNTIKFIVADLPRQGGGDPVVVHSDTETTRLGENLHHSGELSAAAMQRSLVFLRNLKEQARGLNVDLWLAMATSAVRDAINRTEFERLFRKEIGFDLQVVSGEREAELIFKGATSDSRILPGGAPVLVMDSGGGSAEWICGIGTRVERKTSLPLGCVRMTERWLVGDPYTQDSLRALTRHYEAELNAIASAYTASNHKVIVTGGTINTAAAMFQPRNLGKPDVHGQMIRRTELEDLYTRLASMTQAERLACDPRLPPKRADVIVAGISLFRSAMDVFDFSEMTVSLRGLRYGILREMMS
jgi:exopolyphosphatase / guanosine-5'-triphosphate,3'-diphosphate pyrophosphatase